MLKVAAIQMDIMPGDKEKNLKRAEEKIKEAVEKGANIICLPELFTTGFVLKEIHLLAEEEEGKTTGTLCKIAKEENITIIAGSIAVKRGEDIFNTCYVINNKGKISGSYDKCHLFPLMGEDRYFKEGDRASVVHLPLFSIGLMICYDIRFPELARLLALNGANILFIPAEFPNPRCNHWRLLLMARAIENQSYVIGVNRVGKDKMGSYFGHSMVISPWGEIIGEGSEEEEIIYCELNMEKVNKVREKIPSLHNRREDLYSIKGKISGSHY